MDVGTAVAFSAPLAVGIAAFGSGIGLGMAVSGAMEAIGRQPEASGKIMTSMIIGAALIEALTIYALIVFFISLGKMTPEVKENEKNIHETKTVTLNIENLNRDYYLDSNRIA